MEGPEAGEAGVRRVCLHPPSKQPREPLPNMYSHPDKWKELSMGQERQDRPRARRVVGIGAVTIISLTSGLLELVPAPDTPGSPEGNIEGPGTASSEPLLPS